MIAFELHDWIADRFTLPEPQLLDLRDEDPHAAADALRSHWGIGTKPIGHLIKLLEAKGIRVFALAEQHKNVDAFSCWHDGVPFVFLNTFKSAERSRFDAAHELGHLVLHIHGANGSRDVEREADMFASAFLIQRGDLIGQLQRVHSLEQLVIAKRRWGATAQDTYYVSVSRERHEVVVFTEDEKKLPERVDQLTYKRLAHDLQPVATKGLEPDQSEIGHLPQCAEPELEIG